MATRKISKFLDLFEFVGLSLQLTLWIQFFYPNFLNFDFLNFHFFKAILYLRWLNSSDILNLLNVYSKDLKKIFGSILLVFKLGIFCKNCAFFVKICNETSFNLSNSTFGLHCRLITFFIYRSSCTPLLITIHFPSYAIVFVRVP